MNNKFLSLDLDVFTNLSERDMLSFVEYLLTIKNKIRIYEMHQDMLNQVDESGCNVLINCDYHDDLADENYIMFEKESKIANDGDWVSYVKWRKNGKYLWLHPHNQNNLCLGYCNGEIDIYKNRDISGWKSIEKRQARFPVRLSGKISDCAICLSPDYTPYKILSLFDKIYCPKNGVIEK